MAEVLNHTLFFPFCPGMWQHPEALWVVVVTGEGLLQPTMHRTVPTARKCLVQNVTSAVAETPTQSINRKFSFQRT